MSNPQSDSPGRQLEQIRAPGATGGINRIRAAMLIVGVAFALPLRSGVAADIKKCESLFASGRYAECTRMAEQAIEDRVYDEDWEILKARCELTLGQYERAKATVEAGIKRYSWSIRLRLLGRTAYLHAGEPQRAVDMLNEVGRLAGSSPWRFTDVDNLLAIGKAALLLGSDAREVLDAVFERAKTLGPDRKEPYLAIGQLALDKNDFELAAKTFEEADKRFPNDPEILFGLVRAYAHSDSERAESALTRIAEANPFHVPSQLFTVDRLIASENYDAADSVLSRILAVNPVQPEAWAYRAVLAHLEGDSNEAEAYRQIALSSWNQNPAVDCLIGQELSQKYRFSEGAAYQRHALAFDAGYLPAKTQLCQDLLRLGQEREGWKLAAAVHHADGYDVTTFNLLELHDTLTSYRTIEDEDFILRMEAREADLYGERALRLLKRAKQVLCRKYGLKLDHPITVEVFSDVDDFAVRTFGMPAVSGFLGVCFGRVITANSPAAQREHAANWEAVLWHEFCHVVTLELTHNRMPRWLSEGISVYEESQANPGWGQRMNPRYREVILRGDLTPIHQLSAAFLSPKSGVALQFAYYESSLVVEFLIDRYGAEALRQILLDLGAGVPINVALERHTDAVPVLESNFEEFAKARARQLAPAADWTEHDLLTETGGGIAGLKEFLAIHPHHFAGLSLYAQRLIDQQKWAEAKPVLEKLIELYPEDTGADAAPRKLAAVHRKLGEAAEEVRVLENYASRDADAVDVYLRLIEIAVETENWESVMRNVERTLAVNPLIAAPYRAQARAAEALDRSDDAIRAYRALLAMDPDDPAEIHYRLAVQLHERGDASAKRHVLFALEEAPRFRAAHRLLLEMSREKE